MTQVAIQRWIITVSNLDPDHNSRGIITHVTMYVESLTEVTIQRGFLNRVSLFNVKFHVEAWPEFKIQRDIVTCLACRVVDTPVV